MGSTSGQRLLLGAAITLVLAVGVTAVAVHDDDGAAAGVADQAARTTTTTTAAAGPITRVVPASNQAFVTGTVVAASIERTPSVGSLPTPLVVTTPAAGFGAGATIEDAVVDGAPATIVWDAGRPFDLTGDGGALLLGPVDVVLGPASMSVTLPDDVVLGLTPGTYQLHTPVAVGGSGLAETRAGVTFEATEATTLSFRGGASTAAALGEQLLTGPGRVTLDGPLEVQRDDGTTPANHVELPEGAFELRLTPLPDGRGWAVEGTLQGEVIAG